MMILPLMAICDTTPNKLEVSFEPAKTTLLTTKSAEPIEIVPVEPAFVNNAYQIGTAGELKWFEEKTNATTNAGLNKNAVLTADIYYGGNYWIPIAVGDGGKTYTGIFDGAGHTISNLVLSTEWLYNKYITEGKSVADAKLMIQNSGFIGSLKGTIKNMTLENVTVFSNANGGLKQANPTRAQMIDKPISVGAIVGWIAGTDSSNGGIVDNITVTGNLEAEGTGVALGGIVGNAGAGNIRFEHGYDGVDCDVALTINGTTYKKTVSYCNIYYGVLSCDGISVTAGTSICLEMTGKDGILKMKYQ